MELVPIVSTVISILVMNIVTCTTKKITCFAVENGELREYEAKNRLFEFSQSSANIVVKKDVDINICYVYLWFGIQCDRLNRVYAAMAAAKMIYNCAQMNHSESILISREVQYSETYLLRHLVKIHRHVNRPPAKLYKVKGGEYVVIKEIPAKANMLTHNDSFVYQDHDKIFIFYGKYSSEEEQLIAFKFSKYISNVDSFVMYGYRPQPEISLNKENIYTDVGLDLLKRLGDVHYSIPENEVISDEEFAGLRYEQISLTVFCGSHDAYNPEGPYSLVRILNSQDICNFVVKDEFINPIAFVYIGMYSSEKAMINALKYGESIEWLTVDIKKLTFVQNNYIPGNFLIMFVGYRLYLIY